MYTESYLTTTKGNLGFFGLLSVNALNRLTQVSVNSSVSVSDSLK